MASRAKKKITVKNTVATRPGRNGGTLLAGGKPGHKGGPGRPPNIVRILSRKAVKEHKLISRMGEFGAGKHKAPVKEQRQSIETLAHWGWPELKRVELTGKDGAPLSITQIHQIVTEAES